MKVHVYEKAWMGACVVLIIVFVSTILLTSWTMRMHPPSHMEIIDPAKVNDDPRFANPGVTVRADGTRVTMIAEMWTFIPNEITVPAGRPVTFRLTSPDVIHGFEIVGTNVNTMVVPGYVSQLSTTFQHPGEYLIVCHEYCGAGHHTMQAKLVVTGAGS